MTRSLRHSHSRLFLLMLVRFATPTVPPFRVSLPLVCCVSTGNDVTPSVIVTEVAVRLVRAEKIDFPP